MERNETIVITAYGHGTAIDKIAVSIFDEPIGYYSRSSYNAGAYCTMMNSLNLEGDKWINAKIISGNTPYSLRDFHPVVYSFTKTILDCDNRPIQKILREVETKTIAIALKEAPENVKQKIFNNMTKHASEMLKDDIECLRDINTNNITEAQEAILSIVRRLVDSGEIAINFKEEE
jgi:flagellar motor switch protein FliG